MKPHFYVADDLDAWLAEQEADELKAGREIIASAQKERDEALEDAQRYVEEANDNTKLRADLARAMKVVDAACAWAHMPPPPPEPLDPNYYPSDNSPSQTVVVVRALAAAVDEFEKHQTEVSRK